MHFFKPSVFCTIIKIKPRSISRLRLCSITDADILPGSRTIVYPKTGVSQHVSPKHMMATSSRCYHRICKYSISACSWMITHPTKLPPQSHVEHRGKPSNNFINNGLSLSNNSIIPNPCQHLRFFRTQSSGVDLGGRKLGKSSLGDKTIKLARKVQKEINSQNKHVQEQVKKKIPKKYVKENIKTIPNLLTTLRMGSAPVIAYFIANDSFGVAFSMFVLAGLTDMLDGYIARNFKNQRTAFGTGLDPLADKVLISVLTVSLTCAGLIPAPLTALILGRDAGLIVGGFYIRWISLSPPKTLSRYFEFSRVTVKVYPSFISKLNTAVQFSFVAATLASPVFEFAGHPLMQAFMYTTAATTFLSGADDLMTWRKRLKIVKN